MKQLLGGTGGNTCAFCAAGPNYSYTSCWYMANPSLQTAMDLCERVYPYGPNSPYIRIGLGPCTSQCTMNATEMDPRDISMA
jgi:hypothetical protein